MKIFTKREDGDRKMDIVLSVTTVVCALGWLTRYISSTALIYFMKQKGYKLPNDEELKECTSFVTKHLFKKA